MKDVIVVLNPAAKGGRTGRGWPDVAARLRRAGLDFDTVLTDRRGAAVKLARAAVREGRPVIVAAGGDGTINEVANGFFEAGRPITTGSRLAILPMGTGGDFRRMWRLPHDVEALAAVIAARRTRRLDAGLVTCATEGGATATLAFLNVADAGIGGEVVRRVNDGFRLVNGSITFAAASVLTGLGWKNRRLHAVIDGQHLDVVAQQVVVANCRFYGGGMMIAPAAIPDDGLLDVVVAGDLSVVEAAQAMLRYRRGTHLQGPGGKISHRLARRVELTSPEVVRLDVDGEQPGILPATFEILPAAIEVVVP
ncbi:MAG: diacylglycerol kinase family lipid kinase [Candidatus Dormibacteraeota bacterium]|nr:diacylglycerol kinase family lipid kinase [Candidatus Dormibacteraeota bacterium]